MNQYADLAAQLRVYSRENYPRLRSTLYYNLPTILDALDIAASTSAALTLGELVRLAEENVRIQS